MTNEEFLKLQTEVFNTFCENDRRLFVSMIFDKAVKLTSPEVMKELTNYFQENLIRKGKKT